MIFNIATSPDNRQASNWCEFIYQTFKRNDNFSSKLQDLLKGKKIC
jgi:hypothetical protein